MYTEIVKSKQEAILTGEIGALLHDIGKCHPNFIKAQSLEHKTGFRHENIDEFLGEELVNLFKNENCKLKINDKEADIYSITKKHHDKDPQNDLIDLLKSCDHLDSADDKGVVRKKQPKDSTLISSPFGFPKEKIDLLCLQKRLEDLQTNLTGLFQNYISGTLNITYFRKCLINNLKTAFSHVLGETRIPANDVTLWDHSHSTASLFKSVLCAMVLGENPDKAQLQCRIFGFCWNGIDFINRGKKIADIIQRNSIIEEIKGELKDKFESQIPIGNVVYEDNNGIYFTFPALEGDKARALARECAEIGLEVIRGESDNEIWPFFTLSKPSRTLTILAEELKFASKKRTIPKMTPTLFSEKKEKDKNEEKISDNPEMSIPQSGEDICPICRLRAKPEKEDRCNVCKKRQGERLSNWLDNRENTIWIDEVADKNNRIAVLTLSFDLSKWLDGTMVGTIFSQSFEDWKKSKDAIRFFSNKQNTQKLEKRNIKINGTPINLSKNCLKIITDEDPLKDLAFKSELINTFYEDVKSSQDKKDDNYIKNFIDNLRTRVSPEPFTSSNLQKLIFTQNPSPARLYRIWKETEDFFNLVTQEIKKKVYPCKWKRIKFALNYEELKSKTSEKIAEKIPYIIKIRGLEPENLLALHTSNGEFYTIESLEKFKFNDKPGIDAVKDALNKEIYWIAKEDEPDINLLINGQNIEISGMLSEEDYHPFIEITKSPLSMRLIVPASDSMVILESIVKLYNQRFEKVLGKLPLNIGLLVSKRKFPLYVLLDAEERLFHTKEFKESVAMGVWWDITSIKNDEHYSFYPINKSDNQKYNLDDLAPLSKGNPYALYPGYFDFDLLLGTHDRYNIVYEEKRRANEDYRLFSNRPYYFYQIPQMIDLWEILKNNISSAQINFIEEVLTNKLREWCKVNEEDKEEVFRKFTEATVKDAFSNNWDKLRIETQDFILSSAFNGLLLDTIILFRHTIKGGAIENE